MMVALHEIRFHTLFAHDHQLLFRYFKGNSSGGHSAAGMPYRLPSKKKKGTSVGLCCMMQYGCSDADASIKEDTV